MIGSERTNQGVAGSDRRSFAGTRWCKQRHSNPTTGRRELSSRALSKDSAELAWLPSDARPSQGRCITVGMNCNRVHHGSLHLAMHVRSGSGLAAA
jgi:hypothetical protein